MVAASLYGSGLRGARQPCVAGGGSV